MFDIGQKVLCINDKPLVPRHLVKFSELGGLTAGNVYTIRDIYENTVRRVTVRFYQDNLCLELEEIVRDTHGYGPGYRGFASERFKPLDDSSMDVFKKMCKKSLGENMNDLSNEDLLKIAEEICEEV